MRHIRILTLALVAAGVAGGASAADRCSVHGKMEKEAFQLGTCAVAFYPSQNSVAIWFTEKPLSAEALEKFEIGSYADLKGTGRVASPSAPAAGRPRPTRRPPRTWRRPSATPRRRCSSRAGSSRPGTRR